MRALAKDPAVLGEHTLTTAGRVGTAGPSSS